MPKIKINRHFGFVMAGGFLLMGAVIPLFRHKTFHYWLIILALVFFLVSLIKPVILEKPRVLWLNMGEKLGFMNSCIFFTVIYLVLFTLIHLIFILIKRDKMKKAWKKYTSTYQAKTEISSFADPF